MVSLTRFRCKAIFKLLPPRRRTILASATLPANLDRYRHLCLRPGHVDVSAMDGGQKGGETNAQLEESAMEVSIDSWLPVLYQMLQSNVSKSLKTILFMQAAQQTRLMAHILRAAFSGAVFEIHSRLSQSQRIKQLDGFKGKFLAETYRVHSSPPL